MEWVKYWPVLLFLINVLTAWAAWSLRQLAKREVESMIEVWGNRLSASDGEIRDDVDDHERRVLVLEEGIKALPKREDVEKVGAAVAAVAQTLSATNATLVAVKESNRSTQESVDRLYRFQLEKSL